MLSPEYIAEFYEEGREVKVGHQCDACSFRFRRKTDRRGFGVIFTEAPEPVWLVFCGRCADKPEDELKRLVEIRYRLARGASKGRA